MSNHFCVEQALSVLAHQKDNVRHIRTQAFVVATFAFLTARFMSPTDSGILIGLTEFQHYLAALLFLAAIFFAAGSALMQRRWAFALDLDKLVEIFEIEREDKLSKSEIQQMRCSLLYTLIDHNEPWLVRSNTTLSIAILCSVAQLLVWLV